MNFLNFNLEWLESLFEDVKAEIDSFSALFKWSLYCMCYFSLRFFYFIVIQYSLNFMQEPLLFKATQYVVPFLLLLLLIIILWLHLDDAPSHFIVHRFLLIFCARFGLKLLCFCCSCYKTFSIRVRIGNVTFKYSKYQTYAVFYFDCYYSIIMLG